jgi:hypothetical protein|tara:strand:- start:386 stop:841 length:456 start_codon:yes stop_codon:yes gene_type:complete
MKKSKYMAGGGGMKKSKYRAGGGANKSTKGMTRGGGMKNTKGMANGGAMKGTKYMSLGGAAKSELKANPGMGKMPKSVVNALERTGAVAMTLAGGPLGMAAKGVLMRDKLKPKRPISGRAGGGAMKGTKGKSNGGAMKGTKMRAKGRGLYG